MKHALALFVLVGAFAAGQPALAATSDDAKWINQCVKDNQDQGAKDEVILIYCTCMNEKMDDNESQSISQWEKTHVEERKACDRRAGWK